jgi:hypothetical protein
MCKPLVASINSPRLCGHSVVLWVVATRVCFIRYFHTTKKNLGGPGSSKGKLERIRAGLTVYIQGFGQMCQDNNKNKLKIKKPWVLEGIFSVVMAYTVASKGQMCRRLFKQKCEDNKKFKLKISVLKVSEWSFYVVIAHLLQYLPFSGGCV